MDQPQDAPPARHRRSVGPILALAVIVAGLALVGGGLASRGRPTPSVSSTPTVEATPEVPSPGGPTSGYLVTPTDLADRAAKAADGVEPWATAQADLLGDAESALATAPQPMAALDIPGTEGPFVDDTATAYGLGLAYAVTHDVRYAKAARVYIMDWVRTTTQLVNACPTDGSCQTSLIIARVVPGFVFAADLIRPSGAMSGADDSALRTWLNDLILPNLPTRDGNWGDAGDFSRAVITDYLGDHVGFARALDEWRARMDAVPADGHLPDEVRRGTSGMTYTQEALQYKIGVARLAELRGVDLWTYVGKQGATVRTAIDYLRRFWSDPRSWPWDPAVEVPSPGPMWEIAYQHWQDSSWPVVFGPDRPFGEVGHSAIRWTTLTNGIPIP